MCCGPVMDSADPPFTHDMVSARSASVLLKRSCTQPTAIYASLSANR